MASQAPSSSSNPLARRLQPVTPTQQLLANQARLARAQASRKGQPAEETSGASSSCDSSVDLACICSSVFSTVWQHQLVDCLGLDADGEVRSSQGAKTCPSLSSPHAGRCEMRHRTIFTSAAILACCPCPKIHCA
eukprot:1158370-Pelagomonas_calceolata.AAC.12